MKKGQRKKERKKRKKEEEESSIVPSYVHSTVQRASFLLSLSLYCPVYICRTYERSFCPAILDALGRGILLNCPETISLVRHKEGQWHQRSEWGRTLPRSCSVPFFQRKAKRFNWKKDELLRRKNFLLVLLSLSHTHISLRNLPEKTLKCLWAVFPFSPERSTSNSR